MKFQGTGVALITPFLNGTIDYEAFEKLINYVIDSGVDFLVPLGSTGEAAVLSEEEQREVLDFVIRTNNGRLPLVAGNFGGNNTAALCRKIEEFDFTGIDAILSSSPSYVKPTQKGIFQHYAMIEKKCPVPIIIYNVPSRTGKNIEPSTVIRLAEYSEKFVAIKEASGEVDQLTQIIKGAPNHFSVLSGDDPSALTTVTIGGHGVISVLANVYPESFSRMITAGRESKNKEASHINNQLYHLNKWMYIEGNPAGVKSAAQILDICTNEVRLPLTVLSKENYKLLQLAMNQIDL